MHISTSTLLNILAPKLDKTLKEKICHSSKDGVVDLKELVKNKDIKTLLDNLFRDIISKKESKTILLDMLKNSKYLFELKDFQQDIKTLAKYISFDTKLQNIVKHLDNFLIDIKNPTQQKLQSTILNSGVFLESKIKNNISVSDDLKAILLKLNNELENINMPHYKETKHIVEKILAQIEFYQALSSLSNNPTTYLGFDWNDLEESQISFYTDPKTQTVSCQINLTLDKYNQVKVLLQLDKKNHISINIAVEDDTLKAKMQQNLQTLRKHITKLSLLLLELNVFSFPNQNSNPYNTDKTLAFNLDLKV